MSLVNEAARRASAVKLETLVAAVAALATGAAVFLMPATILQEAVNATGLPSALPPLEPPLGTKARLGLALLAAGSALSIVLLLMRLFGAVSAKPHVSKAAEAAELPRVRRRDRHPDAPVRAPFSVTRDAGVAADEIEAGWQEQAEEVPPVLRRIKAGRSAEPELVTPAEDVDELIAVQAEPVEKPRPAVPEPEPVAAEGEWEPEPEPLAVAEEPVLPVAGSRPVWLDDSVPQPEPRDDESLSDLLARFERAMDRRSASRGVSVRSSAAAVPAEENEAADDRLRSALENLKRFAPRHG